MSESEGSSEDLSSDEVGVEEGEEVEESSEGEEEEEEEEGASSDDDGDDDDSAVSELEWESDEEEAEGEKAQEAALIKTENKLRSALHADDYESDDEVSASFMHTTMIYREWSLYHIIIPVFVCHINVMT